MLQRPVTCRGCPLDTLATGFMVPDGAGSTGVLLVGEALGEREAEVGRPFVGPAGKVLSDCLTRAGLRREEFWIANALWCRPPNNNISGAYTPDALQHCWDQHLLPTIQRLRPRVIMPLGNTALHQFTWGDGDVLAMRGYPQPWRQATLLPSVHPSYILRGNANYEVVLIHDLQRAVALAQSGWHPTQTHYVLDPSPEVALAWLNRFLPTGRPVSFDIETADKRREEDELDLRSSAPITRISFALNARAALSIPATAPYHAVIRHALGSANPKIAWNMSFDVPRLEAKGFEVKGQVFDGMIAWHVLHSDLPKSLGFVASMLLPDQPRWKHLNRQSPAFYNAADSDVALRITEQVWTLLKSVGMWQVYQEQIVDVEPVYQHMHKAGMRVDATVRRAHAETLHTKLTDLTSQVQDLVPSLIKPVKVYKQAAKAKVKFPQGQAVLVMTTIKRCPQCQKQGKLNAKHPCQVPLEDIAVPTEQWHVTLPFVVSWQGIQAYQDFYAHKPVKRQGKRTTDETAIRSTMLKYPTDPFYPLILDIREVQKLAGTYIGKIVDDAVVGGLPVHADGRCHPTITNNPDTLRTSMINPNLQQIPHGGGLQGLVKEMFVAPAGQVLWEIDYSGIEALLVGYFARSPQLIRLARMGVHDYVNAYALHTLDKKIPASDLPQLDWDDATLKASLRQFKQDFPKERFVRKRLVHGHHYLMGPFKAQEVLLKELGRVVPIKDIKAFFRFYDELFPEIGTWQRGLCLRVDGTDADADPGLGIKAGAGWVRNPSGMVHRYFQVLRWQRIADGSWTWTHGTAAKSLIAFNPQHSAAAIGRRAIRAIAREDAVAKESLRLFIHDSLVGECAAGQADAIMNRVSAIMSRPVPWLPLPAEWNMGTHLAVGVEAKAGKRWSDM